MPTDSPAAALASATPDELAHAAETALARARAGVARLADEQLTGEEALETFDETIAAITNAADVAELVAKVHPDPHMRTAGEQAMQQLYGYHTEIKLDRGVYDALRGVDLAAADAETRHWVGKTLRDFRRNGVDRDPATREQVRQLRDELVGLGQSFIRNISSDTRSTQLPASALAGMPEDWAHAHPAGADGTITVTTDNPDVVPLLTYSRDAAARERMLRLWRQRGHPANVEVLRQLLARRHELATLLGYSCWAAYDTEDKMIGSEHAAAEFLDRLSQRAGPRMSRDYAALLERKQQEDPAATTVDPWDSRYLEERVKSESYALDSQVLRPYFEYRRVRDGLMAVSATLFGIEFQPRPDLPVWHPEVDAFDVTEAGSLVGRIFLDMHPRPDKFSHAAMYSMTTGKATAGRLPEAALLCNFPRPGEFLEYRDVSTFFHEFGHLLHHLFGGRRRWSVTSGVETEWDFVEAPSQLLEEWTMDAATLQTFALHADTGEPVPAALVEQLRAAEAFGRGLWARQQVFYAMLSLELHRRVPDRLDPLALEAELQQQHTPFAQIPDTWLHLSFGHLQSYGATYYTYLWSLVIAKDMLTAFDPKHLLDRGAANRYRSTVLDQGGSAPAAELVRNLLGRDHNFDAFGHWLDD